VKSFPLIPFDKDARYKIFDELIELLDGVKYSSLKVVRKAK